jgi:hypothetical protein
VVIRILNTDYDFGAYTDAFAKWVETAGFEPLGSRFFPLETRVLPLETRFFPLENCLSPLESRFSHPRKPSKLRSNRENGLERAVLDSEIPKIMRANRQRRLASHHFSRPRPYSTPQNHARCLKPGDWGLRSADLLVALALVVAELLELQEGFLKGGGAGGREGLELLHGLTEAGAEVVHFLFKLVPLFGEIA